MKKSHTLRILLALLVIFGAFAYIVYGLAQLQLVKGEGYSDSAGRKSIKTIRTTGKRGMITDADSVILAMTEDVYNVTFYRDASKSKKADYLSYTKSIIEAIQIIEKYGGELCVDLSSAAMKMACGSTSLVTVFPKLPGTLAASSGAATTISPRPNTTIPRSPINSCTAAISLRSWIKFPMRKRCSR